MSYKTILCALAASLAFVLSPVAAQAQEFELSGVSDVASIEASLDGTESVDDEAAINEDASGESEGEAGLSVDATSSWRSDVTGVTLGSGIIVGAYADFDQSSVYANALNSVISWRKDALNDPSIKFEYYGTWYTVSEYLAKVGISKDSYLSPQWSNYLECIAMQRAIENCVLFDHTRPDGTSCWTAEINGYSSSGEVIAMGTPSISSTIDLWASEKSEYIKEVNGQSHGVTGHYTALIDPSNTYYGFAGCGGAWAGEMSNSAGAGGTSPTGLTGTVFVELSVADSYISGVNWQGETTLNVGSTSLLYALSTGPLADFVVLGEYSSSNPGVATITDTNDAIYVTAVSKGTTTITLVSGPKTYTTTVKVIDGKVTYRLYNRSSGQHLYTLDVNEYNTLGSIGWVKEGYAWTSPTSSSTPVYRLYNSHNGDHHYTTSLNEYNTLKTIGWKQEGIAWYSDDAKGVAVYRLFNPNETVGTHHYTISQNEYNTLGTIGWVKEGVAWYGVAD